MSHAVLATLASQLGWRIARREYLASVSDLLARAKDLPWSEEGWVLRFESGLRLKVKGDAYRKLHALAVKVTPLGVWNMMVDGKDLDAVRGELPEEFWGDFDNIRHLLLVRLNVLTYRLETQHGEWGPLSDKEVGLRLGELPEDIRRLLFIRRKKGTFGSNPELRSKLFDAIRPTGNVLEGYIPSSAADRLVDG